MTDPDAEDGPDPQWYRSELDACRKRIAELEGELADDGRPPPPATDAGPADSRPAARLIRRSKAAHLWQDPRASWPSLIGKGYRMHPEKYEDGDCIWAIKTTDGRTTTLRAPLGTLADELEPLAVEALMALPDA